MRNEIPRYAAVQDLRAETRRAWPLSSGSHHIDRPKLSSATRRLSLRLAESSGRSTALRRNARAKLSHAAEFPGFFGWCNRILARTAGAESSTVGMRAWAPFIPSKTFAANSGLFALLPRASAPSSYQSNTAPVLGGGSPRNLLFPLPPASIKTLRRPRWNWYSVRFDLNQLGLRAGDRWAQVDFLPLGIYLVSRMPSVPIRKRCRTIHILDDLSPTAPIVSTKTDFTLSRLHGDSRIRDR